MRLLPSVLPIPRVVAVLVALAALGLAGCETRATQDPCPGSIQGTFRLRGVIAEGAECADAGGAAPDLDLTVAVSFVDDGGAAVCLQRPLSEPLVGTRSGDSIDVATPARSASSRGCACTIEVAERITGALGRDAAGVTGFTGELRTSFSPAGGAATCGSTETATCAVPCVVRWTLTAG